MKKERYLLLVVLLFPMLAIAQTNWVTQKLDDNLSIKFPLSPEKSTKSGAEVYVVKERDSIMYSAGIVDMKNVSRLDSASLVPLKDTQGFANGLTKTMAAQKPNYTFGNVNIGKWKTFTSYQILGSEKTTKATLTVQMIFIGSKLYILSCRVPENVKTEKKDLFFSSATLLK